MRMIRITMRITLPPAEIPPAPALVTRVPASRAPPRQCSSRELLGNGDRLLIEHAGETYVLRLTRQGKLILTK